MDERAHIPDADRQEQLDPAGPRTASDPVERAVVPADAPEADLLEQLTPAGPQPDASAMPAPSGIRRELIPEADALDQATPADHEIFEDDE